MSNSATSGYGITRGGSMMYENLWDINYQVVPQKFLEESIDRLIDALEHEPNRADEIAQMIREVRQELVRRL